MYGLIETLEDDTEALLQFVYLCPVGVLQLDAAGAVQMLNPMAVQLLMSVGGESPIADLFETLKHCAPELRNLVMSFHQPSGQICDNHRIYIGGAARGSSGDLQVLSCTLMKVDENCLMVMLNDISAQVAQERRLAEADSWMAAIFSNVNDFACFSLDAAGCIDSWNRSGVRQTGFDEADVLGHSLAILYASDHDLRSRVAIQLDGAQREGWHLQEGLCRTKAGGTVWCQVLVTVLHDKAGQVAGYSLVLRDITERKMTADELRRLLREDHLTGASNRAHFFDVAVTEVARWKRTRGPLSLVMIDADHFKHINDRFGHDAGDAVLKELVARCRTLLRPTDILARFGGEEFTILLPGSTIADTMTLAERIRLAVATAPFSIGDRTIDVSVSIGCACMSSGIEDINALLKSSDLALYSAKEQGRNRSRAHPPWSGHATSADDAFTRPNSAETWPRLAASSG